MLPATLVVVTFALATACNDGSSTESSDSSNPCAGTPMQECGDSQCSWSESLDMCLPSSCSGITDMALCNDEPGCAWLASASLCENICAEIIDQAECQAIARCEWGDGVLDTDTTGGEPTCHEPFV